MAPGWRYVAPVFFALGWAGACNSINGTGNFSPAGPPLDSGRGGTAEAGGDAGGPEPDSSEITYRSPDAHIAPDADAQVVVLDASSESIAQAGAGLCTGLAMVFRFDDRLDAQGRQPQADPGANYEPGKFGKAVLFSGAQSYAAYSVSGVMNPSVGTITMWVKPTTGWAPPCSAQTFDFFGLDDNGVLGQCAYDGLGAWLPSPPPQPDIGASMVPAAGQWNPNDFNHLAFTWNAGTSEIAVTLAGVNRAASNTPWVVPDTGAVLHIGDPYKPASLLDDVAVWSRVLSPVEIEAVYTLGKSLGDLCNLQ